MTEPTKHEIGNVERFSRTRTVTWQDPMVSAGVRNGRNGLEYLQALIAGRHSLPIGALMGFELIKATDGCAVFRGQPAEYHYNPMGSVHGGFACTLLDSALGCAVMTKLPIGKGYGTVQINVHMVRAITTSTGVLLARGRSVHPGGRMATAEGELVGEEDGKLYAHGTTACMVFDLPPESNRGESS